MATALALLLAWAAEAAQLDISGSLATAVLAVIAVLPEYAVELYLTLSSEGAMAPQHEPSSDMDGAGLWIHRDCLPALPGLDVHIRAQCMTGFLVQVSAGVAGRPRGVRL